MEGFLPLARTEIPPVQAGYLGLALEAELEALLCFLKENIGGPVISFY